MNPPLAYGLYPQSTEMAQKKAHLAVGFPAQVMLRSLESILPEVLFDLRPLRKIHAGFLRAT